MEVNITIRNWQLTWIIVIVDADSSWIWIESYAQRWGGAYRHSETFLVLINLIVSSLEGDALDCVCRRKLKVAILGLEISSYIYIKKWEIVYNIIINLYIIM